MRVRIGDADDLAFVLEDQNIVDLRVIAEFEILIAPDAQQVDDLRQFQLGQGNTVIGTVADDAGDAGRRAIRVDP